MKTSTLKLLIVKLTLFFMVAHVSSQDLVGTRIDVQGTRFSDQMWLFSVPSCTYNFDNGWDGIKMFGTSLAPQLFAIEPDGYYQVASIPDVNNTYLGFSAGVDTFYTFTFTHENLTTRYQKLYLIDSVANKTIDIYQSGTTYAFTALTTNEPVKRFKIVTSLPQIIIVPTVPPDTIVIPPIIQTDSIVTQNPPVQPTPIVDPTNPTKNGNKNSKNQKDKAIKIKIYSSDKKIYIENPGIQKGKIKVCHAETGKVIRTAEFIAEGTSVIKTDIPSGTYIVTGVTPAENVSTLIIIR